MRLPGRISFQLVFAMIMVALVPLFTAIYTGRLIDVATRALFDSMDVVGEVDRSLSVYSELARAMKEGLRAKADAVAAHEPLRAAAILRHEPSVEQELETVFKLYPDIVSISVSARPTDDPEGEDIRLGYRDRGHPIDERVERKFTVQRALSDRENAPSLTVVFAAPRATLDNIAHASEFNQLFKTLVRDKRTVNSWYFQGYVLATVSLTVPIAIVVGFFLSRRVTRRIAALALATQEVAGGDLSVRVVEEGRDELTDLARAFNRMLGEVADSRARIEFLQRMGTWQEMARRLAHEIKNPLTPIQLAVQECHRRYDGPDKKFRKLLDTTLEIVEEEVNTLRRLVSEFSNFARLPRADLAAGDLGAFLGEQKARFAMAEGDEETAAQLDGVNISWRLPERPVKVAFDAIMLHRVLVNVLANAAQAIRGAGRAPGRIEVNTTVEREQVLIDVDDDGPGISPEHREHIFDPYFTTKTDGTGLGLAIVKKVLVEHGGTIEAQESPQGGARLRLRLPLLGTAASQVALSHSGRQSLPPSQPSA